MKTFILLLLSLSVASAIEVEYLHIDKRIKRVSPAAFVIVSGTLNGLWLQFGGNAIGNIQFDDEKSFVVAPDGSRIPLQFVDSGGQRPGWFWNCQFKKKFTHRNMQEGVFNYHLHLTIAGEAHDFTHELKYRVIERWTWGDKIIQKESATIRRKANHDSAMLFLRTPSDHSCWQKLYYSVPFIRIAKQQTVPGEQAVAHQPA